MVNTLGVYSITNNINNKVYIGESNNIERRWQEHKDELNTNSHHNYKLQNDWNIYGEQNFIFEILEEMQKLDKSYKTNMQLIYLEGKYIKQYDSISNGYNIQNTIEEILSGRKVIMKEKMDAKYLRNLIKNNGVTKESKRKKRKYKKPSKLKSINSKAKYNNKFITCTKFAKWLIQEGYNLEQNKPNILHNLLNQHNVFRKKDNCSVVNDEYIEAGYFTYEDEESKKGKILITETGKNFIIKLLELRQDLNNEISSKNSNSNSTTNDTNIIITNITNINPSFREYIKELTNDKYNLTCKYNDIFKSLRDNEYLYYNESKNNIPYDKYINDLNYFQLEYRIDKGSKEFTIIHILKEGKLFLEKYLKEQNLIKTKEIQSICV